MRDGALPSGATIVIAAIPLGIPSSVNDAHWNHVAGPMRCRSTVAIFRHPSTLWSRI